MDLSDIRGLVTYLSSLRRGAASLYNRGSPHQLPDKSLIGAPRVLRPASHKLFKTHFPYLMVFSKPCILNIKGFKVALSTYPQVSIILEPLDLAQKNNCWPVDMWIKRAAIKNVWQTRST